MHKYKIEVITLNTDGTVTDESKILYADTEEQAELIVNTYVNKKGIVLNEDGEPTDQKYNLYKVNLYNLVYKLISDKSAFFKFFKA